MVKSSVIFGHFVDLGIIKWLMWVIFFLNIIIELLAKKILNLRKDASLCQVYKKLEMSSVRCFISGLDSVGEEGHMCSMPHSWLITDHQSSLYSIILHKCIYSIIFIVHHYAKNVCGWLFLGCMARSYGNRLDSFHRFIDKAREPDK